VLYLTRKLVSIILFLSKIFMPASEVVLALSRPVGSRSNLSYALLEASYTGNRVQRIIRA
jgi:hypothetical protein